MTTYTVDPRWKAKTGYGATTPPPLERLAILRQALQATGVSELVFSAGHGVRGRMGRAQGKSSDRAKVWRWMREQGLSFPVIALITQGRRTAHATIVNALRRTGAHESPPRQRKPRDRRPKARRAQRRIPGRIDRVSLPGGDDLGLSIQLPRWGRAVA